MIGVSLKFIREVGAGRWLSRMFRRQVTKRILRRDLSFRLPTGLSMVLPRDSHFASEVFVTNGNVDWGAEARFTQFLDAKCAVLDVGSHIGYYSLYVLPRIAHVYAFEPDPRSLDALTRNLGSHRNATIVPKAVASKSGVASFVVPEERALSHIQRRGEPDDTLIQVETITLDEFTEPLPLKVTGIKIDVEGFEDIDVLKGASRLMRRDAPLVLIEVEFSAELLAWCKEFGYAIFAFVREPRTRALTFERISAAVDGDTKMLFLVPVRLVAQFDDLTTQPRKRSK